MKSHFPMLKRRRGFVDFGVASGDTASVVRSSSCVMMVA
jgi:hypothetical protein